MQKTEQAKAAIREIDGKLDWIVLMLDINAVNDAYHRFMQMHAGNFYEAPTVADA